MRVIATAGHVDHGKSTLIRRLTGMEPDRLAEERARGLTIDLGFAWTTLPGGPVAFVDVPGHERFTTTMLAGVGPVPAVLFVVAADEGWMPQSTEHLAALDGLGVRHGLLVVTRADLADAAPALAEARARLAATSLRGAPALVVSGRTGEGLDALRAGLDAVARSLPEPDPAADVRLWVDRSFTVAGAGTVVTGTLGAGTIEVGDELEVAGRRVPVRGLQALGEPARRVTGVARVAVNLRGVPRELVRRGDALLTVGAWRSTGELDVRVTAADLPTRLVLHVGSAAVPVHVRPLGADTARLVPARPLPLRAGDRGLLRDPGRRRIAAGVLVLDPRPPALTRRGAARRRGADLAGDPAVAHLRSRGLVEAGELRSLGFGDVGVPVGRWRFDPDHWAGLARRAAEAVADWRGGHPLAAGMPVDALGDRLGVPRDVVGQVAGRAGLRVVDGHVPAPPALPAAVDRAVAAVEADLARSPFRAPDADRLAELGLRTRELAAAVRVGRLIRVTDGVVLAPDAPQRAARVLAGLPGPFTVGEAKAALGTTRRVAVPLLELLDSLGLTRRLPGDTRVIP
ncbi:SelB C-terminal domain-containing protein [Saccharothrix australiensis]|uniref:Selenocysteine-specific translation elongation factor SelB n=1 Tax=Saccharothrix australiensis TaxID=2072 RepID=A0A495W534_9PSEU|nr:SelB C-terminal domain-containing protein [Saccharothrix australiensis]RKT55763.1 selenocysteine-specific translation elongation factor SelB [Saccharothrix australiensis]